MEEFFEDDLDSIVLEFDNGEEMECSIVGVFDIKDKEYIAVLPNGAEDIVFYLYIEEKGEIFLEDIDEEQYKEIEDRFLGVFDTFY